MNVKISYLLKIIAISDYKSECKTLFYKIVL